MSQYDREATYASMVPLFDALWLKKCSFAEEFRNEWKRVLRASARNDQDYSPADPAAIYPVPHSYQGTDLVFHFDQTKLADWFRQDSKLGKKRRVFLPNELTRTLEGTVEFHDSVCHYDPQAEEAAVPTEGKEILVCSLPGIPPPLEVVYGNRRVEESFRGFRGRKLPVYLIQAEFVPAFLCSSFEMCAYLFWMDCCIMGGNKVKVSDKNLKPLLHIFRPSSILTLKGLV